MKMVKRTLIAIALVAFLASSAPAGFEVHYWGPIDDAHGIKVDGHEEVFWPYEYKALKVCEMPILMEIGGYVEVEDCDDNEIILKQVPCDEISKGGDDFPCYVDCEEIKIRANFDVKLGTEVIKVGPVLDEVEGFYDGGLDTVPGDGNWYKRDVCVRAWKAKLWDGTVGDEVKVGLLQVTAKPDV
jgi:hypothetical protein